MLPEPTTFDLAQLAERADVSQRTVRYYIQQGLLPSPEARGPGAHYGPEHLDRLHLIRRLQREHLPLAEIRRRLEALSAKEIRALLAKKPERPKEDAAAYVRQVLSQGGATVDSAARRHGVLGHAASSRIPSVAEGQKPGARSQWDRVELAPDVELHVRRPLTREQNRQVERLMEAARNIFEEAP
jgi:DNA-binding transcriptional MerR regulator